MPAGGVGFSSVRFLLRPDSDWVILLEVKPVKLNVAGAPTTEFARDNINSDSRDWVFRDLDWGLGGLVVGALDDDLEAVELIWVDKVNLFGGTSWVEDGLFSCIASDWLLFDPIEPFPIIWFWGAELSGELGGV
jgi:hypothetical protein